MREKALSHEGSAFFSRQQLAVSRPQRYSRYGRRGDHVGV